MSKEVLVAKLQAIELELTKVAAAKKEAEEKGFLVTCVASGVDEAAVRVVFAIDPEALCELPSKTAGETEPIVRFCVKSVDEGGRNGESCTEVFGNIRGFLSCLGTLTATLFVGEYKLHEAAWLLSPSLKEAEDVCFSVPSDAVQKYGSIAVNVTSAKDVLASLEVLYAERRSLKAQLAALQQQAKMPEKSTSSAANRGPL